jgi:predicted  nucleic acid-binding Zn-ribbon protein
MTVEEDERWARSTVPLAGVACLGCGQSLLEQHSDGHRTDPTRHRCDESGPFMPDTGLRVVVGVRG